MVRLDADAPADPPAKRPETYWLEEFGGNWLPTPAPALGDSTRDALDFCAPQIGPEAEDLKAALATPGAWFIRDMVGETVRIYAPSVRLAARVRYGD